MSTFYPEMPAADYLAALNSLYIFSATPVADGVSISPNCDTSDLVMQTNTMVGGTLTINNPTGAPVEGQKLMVRVKCTNAQTLSFGGNYRGSTTFPLPSTTTGSVKTDYFGFAYNGTDSKWDLIGRNLGF